MRVEIIAHDGLPDHRIWTASSGTRFNARPAFTETMSSQLNEPRRVNWNSDPYPWYDDDSGYTWLQMRRRRKQMEDDIARFDDLSDIYMDSEDYDKAMWLARKGFLSFRKNYDGTVTFFRPSGRRRKVI